MMRLAVALALLAGATQAETITFEADSEARFVRCVEFFGDASCELIMPQGQELYTCVALDGSNEPLGVAQIFSGLPAIYTDLEADLIDRVACQKAM